MTIYTKKGDQGLSALADGKRLSKDELVFTVLGDLDELQAWLGKLRDDQTQVEYHPWIIDVQKKLLAIGAYIATGNTTSDFPFEKNILEMENFIDGIQNQLPPLKNFILYGGHPLISNTQISKAVCRRLERHLVSFDKVSKLQIDLNPYINRLSDALFCLSRIYSFRLKVQEIKWLT